jgi:hypothetical protein
MDGLLPAAAFTTVGGRQRVQVGSIRLDYAELCARVAEDVWAWIGEGQ